MDKPNNSRTIHHLNTEQIDWSTVLIPFVHSGDTDGFHKAFDWNCMNCCITHGESNFRRQINNIWFIWIDLIFNSAWWCLGRLCFFSPLFWGEFVQFDYLFSTGRVYLNGGSLEFLLLLFGDSVFFYQTAAGWNPQHVAERRWGLRAPPANR